MLLSSLLSFVAGVLTVLAPCVLPFLPVIVGGSLQGRRARPYIVAASLVLSLLVFTLLLKASTALLGIDARVWSIISGVLVMLLGVSMLFPGLWAGLSQRLRFGSGAHKLLHSAQDASNSWLSAVLTGVALGPVFSSCSPTYAWVVATVLPASPAEGMLYLTLYCVGVAGVLLLIALLGRKLVQRLRWAADPRGKFQRAIAVLFIIVGLFVATGLDKSLQTWLVANGPDLTFLEHAFLPSDR